MLLVYSVYSKVSGTDPLALNRVNLISDLIKRRPNASTPKGVAEVATSATDTTREVRELTSYQAPHKFTRSFTDTGRIVFPGLVQKLQALKRGEKKKVRIAWLGDSMIEGDLLTQTFRKRMQQQFGARGAGFVPIMSVSAANRLTVKTEPKGDWEDEHFRSTERRAPMHLSGHTFFAMGAGIAMTDKTVTDTAQPLEKALICGQSTDGFRAVVNGAEHHYDAPLLFNRVELDNSNSRSITVDMGKSALPVYGLSFEPVSGVVVDNFSFRGSSGIELKTVDTNFLKCLDDQGYYDLVVLEYGVNVLYKREDTEYSYYGKLMSKVLRKLRNTMPHTAFLLISTTDRAFLYDDGTWKTAVGIESLVHLQAELAYANNMAFYNMYTSMGGEGTIASWVDASPAMANLDHVHPNWKGADKLGNMLFDDLMREYSRTAAAKPAHGIAQ